MIIGVGKGSHDLSFGIAGVGHGNGFNLLYNHLIVEIYEQGVSASCAFSVALGPKDINDGGTVLI